jgi:glutathione S-transferase
MSLKIFGTSRSRTFRVLWMASELGLNFEHDPISPQSCRNDLNFRAINPAGTIPAIVDDGFVMAESLAINLYLARRHKQFWPDDIRGEARAIQWSFWVATTLEEPYTIWASHTFWQPEESRDSTLAATAAEQMRVGLDRLELALTEADWLVGEAFTVADLNVASVIPFVSRFERESRPHVADWLDRCRSRPAFRTTTRLP